MKFLIFIFPILLISCQDSNFVKGDCIQKPDQSTVWKISSIKGENATIIQSGIQATEMVQEIKLTSSWIKTKCRK